MGEDWSTAGQVTMVVRRRNPGFGAGGPIQSTG